MCDAWRACTGMGDVGCVRLGGPVLVWGTLDKRGLEGL